MVAVPLSAPIWSLVQRISASEVQLEWNDLSLELSRGYIKAYTIKYTADSASNSSCSITGDVMTTETQDEHMLLTGLSPKSEYCVSVAASTAMGIGIYSRWTQVPGHYLKVIVYFCYMQNIFYFSLRENNCQIFPQKNFKL